MNSFGDERKIFLVEADENHFYRKQMAVHELSDGFRGNARREVFRKSVCACADAGKGDRPEFIFIRQLHGIGIASSQGLLFFISAPVPDGANGMDDKTRRQISSSC